MQYSRGVFDQTSAHASGDNSNEEVQDVSTGRDKAPLRAALEPVSRIHREDARDENSVYDDSGECEYSSKKEKEIEEGKEEANPEEVIGRCLSDNLIVLTQGRSRPLSSLPSSLSSSLSSPLFSSRLLASPLVSSPPLSDWDMLSSLSGFTGSWPHYHLFPFISTSPNRQFSFYGVRLYVRVLVLVLVLLYSCKIWDTSFACRSGIVVGQGRSRRWGHISMTSRAFEITYHAPEIYTEATYDLEPCEAAEWEERSGREGEQEVRK